jgi:hypothetical protein
MWRTVLAYTLVVYAVAALLFWADPQAVSVAPLGVVLFFMLGGLDVPHSAMAVCVFAATVGSGMIMSKSTVWGGVLFTSQVVGMFILRILAEGYANC